MIMRAGSVTKHLRSFLGDGVGAALSRGPDAEQGCRKRLGEKNLTWIHACGMG